MFAQENLSEFLKYLANYPPECEKLPSLSVISKEIGISVAALREQLEVARTLGFIEIRPRTGIRKLPSKFYPSVMVSLNYLMAEDQKFFQQFADLRQKIESAYWTEAVSLLENEDHEALRQIIRRAYEKLDGSPVQIPHEEHKNLHLTIYSKLNNPFVSGILESYWKAYELIGLNFFTDYTYLRSVWGYHQTMVDAIINKEYQAGFNAMVEHANLLVNLLDIRQNNSQNN